MSDANTRWLDWVRRLQAIAQNGLTYSDNPYDVERYELLRELAAEIAAAHTNVPKQRIAALFTNETGYATPKLGVRGVVFQRRKLLLVRERADGLWTLPGGWVDVGDAPSVAVAREVIEESGFEVNVIRMLALYDSNLHPHPPSSFHIYRFFFQCEIIGGAPQTSLETSEVDFFSRDDLPADLSTSRVTHKQLLRFFDFHDHPAWPTDFD